MATPKRTIEEILKELNGGELVGDWARIDGLFGVSTPPIDDKGNLNFLAPTAGIALVAFGNQKTLEVKFFAAKFTDDQSSEKLLLQ